MFQTNRTFEERRDQFDRRFNFMWKFCWVFFFVVLIGVVVQYVVIGYFVGTSYEAIKQDGMKSVVERVWYGEHGQERKLPEK